MRWYVLALLVLAVAATPSFAAGPVLEAQELGADELLYRVWSGRYGDLFPETVGSGMANAAVLAVDIVTQGGVTSRRVVPGTGDIGVEEHPAVVFDDASSTLFLLWQSVSADSTLLRFVEFRGEEFSTPIELVNEHGGFDSTPLLGATRSSFSIVNDAGGTETVVRTVLHALWNETAEDGAERLLYLPIVLFGSGAAGTGMALAPAVVADLGAIGGGDAVPLDLMRHPELDHGVDSQSLVLSFVDPASGRLITARLRSLAGEIGRVADVARHVIIGTGLVAKAGAAPDKIGVVEIPKASPGEVAESVLAAAAGLHPGIASYLAEEARRVVEEGGTTDQLVDKARHVIIGTGARTSGGGVFDPIERTALIEIPVEAGDELAALTNVVEVAVLADRALPGGVGVGARAFSSPTGSAALVMWEEFGAIAYRISEGSDWSSVHRISYLYPWERASIIETLRSRIRRR